MHLPKLLIFIILLTIIIACKKYSDGGFVNQTRKHLFGGNNVGDSKTWKLKMYEVNGIDSTYLIQGASTIPDFYDKFVTFTYDGKDPSPKYKASTFLYDYRGVIGYAYKQMSVVMNHIPFTSDDSIQCKAINNINYCSRNILFPALDGKNSLWDIKKLTKKEFIITNQSNNSYKIILTQ